MSSVVAGLPIRQYSLDCIEMVIIIQEELNKGVKIEEVVTTRGILFSLLGGWCHSMLKQYLSLALGI